MFFCPRSLLPASCVPITTLPLQVIRPQPAISPPLRLQVVAVLHGRSAAVEGKLLVLHEVLPANTQTSADTWRSVDLLAAFLLLEGYERLWEHQYGLIHSYSLGLKDWDERVWQRAKHCIGLFLRQWAIQLLAMKHKVPCQNPLFIRQDRCCAKLAYTTQARSLQAV